MKTVSSIAICLDKLSILVLIHCNHLLFKLIPTMALACDHSHPSVVPLGISFVLRLPSLRNAKLSTGPLSLTSSSKMFPWGELILSIWLLMSVKDHRQDVFSAQQKTGGTMKAKNKMDSNRQHEWQEWHEKLEHSIPVIEHQNIAMFPNTLIS